MTSPVQAGRGVEAREGETMKLRCMTGLGGYRADDVVDGLELESKRIPRAVIDFCFAPLVEEIPKTIKLPIIHDKEWKQLGCWVPSEYLPFVFEEHAMMKPDSKRWLPLHVIPSQPSFVGWANEDSVWSNVGYNGRIFISSERSAAWAEYAVFAVEE